MSHQTRSEAWGSRRPAEFGDTSYAMGDENAHGVAAARRVISEHVELSAMVTFALGFGVGLLLAGSFGGPRPRHWNEHHAPQRSSRFMHGWWR